MKTTLLRNVISFLGVLYLLLLIPACTSSQKYTVSTSQPEQSTNTTPRSIPDDPKLILKGSLDCKTGEVQITGGVLNKGRFQNLDEPFSALSEKGYSKDVLNEMKENLRLCDLDHQPSRTPHEKQGGMVTADMKPEDLKPSLLLEAEIEGSSILFSLSETAFSGPQMLASYLEDKKDQKGCERISENCVKCPDKKIYCIGKKK